MVCVSRSFTLDSEVNWFFLARLVFSTNQRYEWDLISAYCFFKLAARYKKLKKRPALSGIDVVLNPCGLAILTHQHILIMLNAH
jgi:hypothetical protein